MVLGALAGVVCLWACTGLKSMFGYDDSLDVFGVHAVAGALGAIGTGVLMSASLGGVGFPDGVSMGEQVVKQITGTLTALVWSGVGSLIIFKVIDATIGLRVTEEQERDGLDVSDHGEMAYHGDASVKPSPCRGTEARPGQSAGGRWLGRGACAQHVRSCKQQHPSLPLPVGKALWAAEG
jgi:ammonia channel protein AmtB